MTVLSFRGVSKFSSVNTANIFVIGHKEWLQRQRIDAKACSHDPIFRSNYLSGIVPAHRNGDVNTLRLETCTGLSLQFWETKFSAHRCDLRNCPHKFYDWYV